MRRLAQRGLYYLLRFDAYGEDDALSAQLVDELSTRLAGGPDEELVKTLKSQVKKVLTVPAPDFLA